MCFYSGGAFASGTKKFSLPAYWGIDVRAYAFCSLSFAVFYAKTKKRKRTGVNIFTGCGYMTGEIKSKEWHFWIPEMDFTMQSAKSRLCLAVKIFWKKLWKGKDPPLMRMIPYHSVGKKMGMLCAFRAQRLEIECRGDWQFVEDAWVAVCEECVSVDGEYEMILHPDMLNNENGKEKS